MSTEFLTRRMDLIHSLEMSNKVNYLTMDTSYPVKVKGIILKVYLATASLDNYPYNDNQRVFCVRNQANETVADFTGDQCFNFDGDKLDALPAQGESVLALIDLDRNVIFIAPTNSIGGGSFKQFTRRIADLDPESLSNDSDPIIDMMSVNPASFYSYHTNEGIVTGKKQYPEEYYSTTYGESRLRSMSMVQIHPLKTKKDHGAVLMLSQKKTNSPDANPSLDADISSVDFIFDKAQGETFSSDWVDQQPTLYAGYMAPATNGNAYIAPVDINAPGTLRMYETNLERDIDEIINAELGTAYNLLVRAASVEKSNIMNYSFVRDADSMIVYEFYKSSVGGVKYGITPVADVNVDDLNRLQSNIAVCSLATPVGETALKLVRSYSTVDSTMSIVQTIGNLSNDFKDKYAIGYSNDPSSLYQRVMDNTNPNASPLANVPYPGAYFNLIKDLHEEEKYNLLVTATNLGPLTSSSDSINRIPIRDEDNYISMTSQIPIKLKINNYAVEFNIEDSDYAPYITTFWWDKYVDGSRNKGFDILPDSSGSNHYAIGGADILTFGDLFDSTENNMVRISSTVDYSDASATYTAVTSMDECVVSYSLQDSIIDDIVEAAEIPENVLEKMIFNFKARFIAEELEDLVYNVDDTSHGTTFTSIIKVGHYISIGNAAVGNIPIGTGSTANPVANPVYTFEYNMQNNDAQRYYANTPRGDAFLKILKMKIEYPHMVDIGLDSNEYLWENITVFIALKYYRAVYIDTQSGSTERNLWFGEVSGVDKAYIGTFLIYDDSAHTTEVTKDMYTSYKNANVDKVFYWSNGEENDYYKTNGFHEYKVTVHFSPSSSTDIQQNDIYYLEQLVYHRWNGSAWVTSAITEPTKYSYIGRSLNLFQYAASQVVPSAVAFYQPTMPWPRPARVGAWPPTPDTQYGIDFQKWFKTIECWKLFSKTESDALKKIRMYNKGIDDKFIYTDSTKTKYRSLYDFIYDLYTKDVGTKVNDNNRSQTTEINYGTRGYFDRNTVSDWDVSSSYSVSAKWDFRISPDHPHGSIDTKLIEIAQPDIDYSLNPINRINVARVITGLKKVSALSLTDENGDKLLLTGTDILPLSADEIVWKDLLIALNNNKRIDLNGPLNGLKKYAKSDYKDGQYPRKINRQNTVAYALTYDHEKNSSGVAIEGTDLYGMAKSFWTDQLFTGATHQAYWWMKVGSESDDYIKPKLPVLCAINGTSISNYSPIATDFAAGDHNPVRFETFYFETDAMNTGGRTRIVFNEVDKTNGLIARLAAISEAQSVPQFNPVTLYIAGHPVSATIDYTNFRFYIRDGFHRINNKKYFYCEDVEHDSLDTNIEGRKSPMATGFINIGDHHSSSSADKVKNLYSDTDDVYKEDYLDGLYYATYEEGILRSTTRTLLYNYDDVIHINTTPSVLAIYNTSATGYANLYNDTTITRGGSADNKEYVCVFDDKGRITSMTQVTSDPSF